MASIWSYNPPVQHAQPTALLPLIVPGIWRDSKRQPPIQDTDSLPHQTRVHVSNTIVVRPLIVSAIFERWSRLQPLDHSTASKGASALASHAPADTRSTLDPLPLTEENTTAATEVVQHDESQELEAESTDESSSTDTDSVTAPGHERQEGTVVPVALATSYPPQPLGCSVAVQTDVSESTSSRTALAAPSPAPPVRNRPPSHRVPDIVPSPAARPTPVGGSSVDRTPKAQRSPTTSTEEAKQHSPPAPAALRKYGSITAASQLQLFLNDLIQDVDRPLESSIAATPDASGEFEHLVLNRPRLARPRRKRTPLPFNSNDTVRRGPHALAKPDLFTKEAVAARQSGYQQAQQETARMYAPMWHLVESSVAEQTQPPIANISTLPFPSVTAPPAGPRTAALMFLQGFAPPPLSSSPPPVTMRTAPRQTTALTASSRPLRQPAAAETVLESSAPDSSTLSPAPLPVHPSRRATIVNPPATSASDSVVRPFVNRQREDLETILDGTFAATPAAPTGVFGYALLGEELKRVDDAFLTAQYTAERLRREFLRDDKPAESRSSSFSGDDSEGDEERKEDRRPAHSQSRLASGPVRSAGHASSSRSWLSDEHARSHLRQKETAAVSRQHAPASQRTQRAQSGAHGASAESSLDMDEDTAFQRLHVSSATPRTRTGHAPLSSAHHQPAGAASLRRRDPNSVSPSLHVNTASPHPRPNQVVMRPVRTESQTAVPSGLAAKLAHIKEVARAKRQQHLGDISTA